MSYDPTIFYRNNIRVQPAQYDLTQPYRARFLGELLNLYLTPAKFPVLFFF